MALSKTALSVENLSSQKSNNERNSRPSLRIFNMMQEQVAVEEEAEKTTAAIDGLLLRRQVRLDQLIIEMGDGPAGLPGAGGRYPQAGYGTAGSTTGQGGYPPRPRRR